MNMYGKGRTRKGTMAENTSLDIIKGMVEKAAAKKVAEQQKVKNSETTTGKNLEARKKAWAEAITLGDDDVLDQLSNDMAAYVNNIPYINSDPHVLTRDEANQLMAEHLSNAKILEFLNSRKDTIKSLVFESIAQEKGETEKGDVVAPEYGKRFAKEGGGSKKPTLNEGVLQKLMGEEEWKKVTDEEVVYTLNEDKLLSYLSENPQAMEWLKEATVPGAPAPFRFAVRNEK